MLTARPDTLAEHPGPRRSVDHGSRKLCRHACPPWQLLSRAVMVTMARGGAPRPGSIPGRACDGRVLDDGRARSTACIEQPRGHLFMRCVFAAPPLSRENRSAHREIPTYVERARVPSSMKPSFVAAPCETTDEIGFTWFCTVRGEASEPHTLARSAASIPHRLTRMGDHSRGRAWWPFLSLLSLFSMSPIVTTVCVFVPFSRAAAQGTMNKNNQEG